MLEIVLGPKYFNNLGKPVSYTVVDRIVLKFIPNAYVADLKILCRVRRDAECVDRFKRVISVLGSSKVKGESVFAIQDSCHFIMELLVRVEQTLRNEEPS